jgi:hypothetical protein
MRLIYFLATIIGALLGIGAAGMGGASFGGSIPAGAPGPLIGAIGAPIVGAALLTVFVIRYLRGRS